MIGHTFLSSMPEFLCHKSVQDSNKVCNNSNGADDQTCLAETITNSLDFKIQDVMILFAKSMVESLLHQIDICNRRAILPCHPGIEYRALFAKSFLDRNCNSRYEVHAALQDNSEIYSEDMLSVTMFSAMLPHF